LYVNPTLTAAADWRSIEWSNNSGWGLYGEGTANNYLGGNLLLGSATSTGERLQVTGTMKVTGASTFGGNMSISANVIINGTLPYIQMSPSAWGASFYLQSGVNLLANAAGDYTGFFIPAARGFGFVQGTNPSMVFAPTSYNVLVGTSTDVASAIFNVSSTTKGFLPPRMTTTQKNAISSPAAGLVVYDTTLNKLCVYTTAWETITSV
jgi:autotransporter-associated beta strand protein